ncbi:MAG: EamA family transporter, partial [Xanthobacteraceae bacterium]|nr:EamA family transporter [Xanthobacteraceae bacterium]
MRRKSLIIGSFASIYLLWGSTYLAIAVALQSIPPFTLMGFRSLCGGLVLIALCGKEISRASLRTWFNAGLCGLLFFVGCHGLLAWAQQTVTSGVAAIALATIPLWIALADFLFSKKDRPGRYSLAALIPGFVGVAIVAWQSVGAGRAGLIAIAALLLASLSWAVATILSRGRSEGGSTTLLSGMQLSIGGIVLFAIAYLSGEFRDFAVSAVSSRSLEAVLYLTISGSVIGFAAYHWLLQNVPTPLVATYTFVNPVVAVVLGFAVLGEPLSMATMAGALLVIASVAAMWAAENFAHPRAGPDAAARSKGDVAERNGPQLALEPLDGRGIGGCGPENRNFGPGFVHRFSMFRVRPFAIAQ